MEEITQLKSKIKGIHAPLIELYSPQSEKYQQALEIAFKNKNFYLVVDNSEVAYKVIDVIRETTIMRMTFLPLDIMKKVPEILEKPNIDGVIDYAINLINFEEKYRDVIYYGLGETLIVKNRDVADKLIKKYRMVTLDGIIFEKDGKIVINNKKYAISNLKANLEAIKNYFNNQKILDKINIGVAIDTIKKKSETEIRQIIDLSYNEIEDLLAKFNIKETDKLTCEIKDTVKLTDREKEFFELVKKGYSAKEISNELMVSTAVVKKNIIIFIAKLLLGLYPDLKNQQLPV